MDKKSLLICWLILLISFFIPCSFILAESEICKPGLVPCGRNCDVLETPWDERNLCQIKHFFIMFYLILNFFLWTMIPLILVVLIAISGIIFYFSYATETTDPITKVKTLWKSVGIGLIIIFLSWHIACFILTLFGYQVGIFGPWWKF